jgi:hypothetical protein
MRRNVVSPSTSTTSARPTKRSSSRSLSDGVSASETADVARNSPPDDASDWTGSEGALRAGGGSFFTMRARRSTVRAGGRETVGAAGVAGADGTDGTDDRTDVLAVPEVGSLCGAVDPGAASGWIGACRGGEGSGLGAA